MSPDLQRFYEGMCGDDGKKQWFWKDFEKQIAAEMKEPWGLINRRQYIFTEYYDAATWMIQRFQKIRTVTDKGESVSFSEVEKFGENGFLFKRDWDLYISAKHRSKKKVELDKRSVDIGENYIRNTTCDECVGWPKRSFDYEPENYLFFFPLAEVFEFLYEFWAKYAYSAHADGVENKLIVKWPDKIEKRLKEEDIKYECYRGDWGEDLFDIEGTDKDFYERWQGVKVSRYDEGGPFWGSGFFRWSDSYWIMYSVKVKVFKPRTNERL